MPGSWRTTSGTGEPANDLDPPEPVFTDEERRALLSLACAGVRAAVLARPMAHDRDLPDRLDETAGVFVSLHVQNDLRGCIGSVHPDLPLGVLVPRLAGEAATRDPRFLRVEAGELADLQLEVSVLSPLVPIAPDRVDPRHHGVYLRLGDVSAVLLPQVAIREGWDRSRLLAALCEKAGLAASAVHDPAALLLAFTVTTVAGRIEETT